MNGLQEGRSGFDIRLFERPKAFTGQESDFPEFRFRLHSYLDMMGERFVEEVDAAEQHGGQHPQRKPRHDVAGPCTHSWWDCFLGEARESCKALHNATGSRLGDRLWQSLHHASSNASWRHCSGP